MSMQAKFRVIYASIIDYMPRVSPSSNSLTDLALAVIGISYSPPMSSKRRACLQK